MADRQYPRAKDLNLKARLKLVERLYRRGFSTKRIADELEYSTDQAAVDLRAIREGAREFEDHNEFLKAVTDRTADLLTRLNEQEAELWRQFDWHREWVVQVNQFGEPIYERLPNGEKSDEPLMGPRKASGVRSIISQLTVINKNQAEVLGILQKNADVSARLEKTERTQAIILEMLQDADPALFAKIRRLILAAMSDVEVNRPKYEKSARSLDEVLDVEFEEKPHRKSLNG
jgi:hypothetical protein